MRILIAVGRAAECVDPLSAVSSFPWPSAALFTVLTVSEDVRVPPMAELVPAAADVSDVQAAEDASSEQMASSSAALLTERGLQAAGIARRGDPKSTIVDYAKEWGADLIVVGSSEKSRIEKFILGSVSASVIKHASRSVLVVKPDGRDNR
jgi:nucleotide-binding universal stress UspA family protein